jgi:hypothetical protein
MMATAPGAAGPPLGGLRRLTTQQLENALIDVLGLQSDKMASLPEPGREGAQPVDSGFLNGFLAVAEDVAGRYAAGTQPLPACAAAGGAAEATCVKDAVAALGERLFMRPLASDELARYTRTYSDLGPAITKPKAVAAVVTSMLVSPNFFYRIESASPASPRLSGHDVAGRLSLALWDSVPDQTLLAAARAGALGSRDEIVAQATRMLGDAKARRLSHGFFAALVPYEEAATAMRSSKTYPGVTGELLGAFVTETRTFLDRIFFEDAGTFRDLYTAPFSYVTAKLATFYGAPPTTGAAATQFTRVMLPAGQRAGLLTQASVLTALAHPDEGAPVLRGLFVRRNLLCDVIPQPPADVNNPPPPGPNLSQRARLAQHSTGSCAACHTLFDPIGFGLETYDAVGRLVASENGHALTGEGKVPALDGKDVAFKGALELGRALADSAQARRCLVKNLFAHMIATDPAALVAPAAPSAPGAQSAIDEIDRAFVADGQKLGRLPLAIVASPAFRATRFAGGGP